MEFFSHHDGQIHGENVTAAKRAGGFGTPRDVHNEAAFLDTLHTLQKVFANFEPLICDKVKPNSNLSILRLLVASGSAFNVVSSGELDRVGLAGGDPTRTVFAGVGKTDDEIRAGLLAVVLMLNVETEAELDAVARVTASIGKVAPIALGVNPDGDPKTYRYVSTRKKESKFGRDIERALRVAETASAIPSFRMIGMHMHIGSQITSIKPCAWAVAKGLELIHRLRKLGHSVAWYNRGGEFSINDNGREAVPLEAFAKAIVPGIKTANHRLAIEPGRVIAGNAGMLLSRVLYTKQSGEKRSLIQDAAMNDLIRRALYQSYHRIWQVMSPVGSPP